MERKWWTLIAVCVATFMLLVDVTIVNVALPDIQKALGASFSDLEWVIDAYALMLAALLLTSGSLADLFGRRRVFVLGLFIFTISSLLSGLATTPLFLNLARGAQGVGGAAMFSTSLALLAQSFRGRERGVAFGVWGTVTGLAVAIGPVAGGALTTGFGWRWIFLVNVPIGVIAVVLTLARVEESRQPGAHRPDWIGAVTFSGALAALVYALIKGNALGWESTEILACLGGAGVLLLVFLIAERVQRAPMFDLSLFRKPTFSGGSLVAFSLSAGMFALLLYITLYLQDVLGFSALDTGLRLLVLSGGILLTSTIAGRLTSRVPIRMLIGPGLAMVGGGLLLMRGLTPTSQWQHFVPGFILSGAGVGLINPPLASTAVGVVEPARAGMASGINSTFRQVGIATGIAGFGAIFTHTVSSKIVYLLEFTGGIQPDQAQAFASRVAQGTGVDAAIASAPPGLHQVAVNAVRTGYVEGLNQIFLYAAIGVLATAVLAFLLIRQKDFEASAAHAPVAPPGEPVEPAGAAVEPPGAAVGPLGAGTAEATDADPAGAAAEEPAPATGPVAAASVEGAGAGPQPVIAAWPAFRAASDSDTALASDPEPDLEHWPAADAEPDSDHGPAADAHAEPDPGPGLAADAHVEPDSDREPESDSKPGEPGEGEPGPAAAPTVVGGRVRWDEVAAAGAREEAETPSAAVEPRSESVGIEAVFEEQSKAPRAELWVEPAAGDGAPAVAARERAAGTPGRAVPAAAAAADRVARRPAHDEDLQNATASLLPDLSGPSRAVVQAAEQAIADCGGQIERLVTRWRETQLGRAAGIGPAGGPASPVESGLVVALRDRLAALSARHELLVTALQLHTQAVNDGTRAALEHIQAAGRHAEHAAQARHELYGLIAALAALTDEMAGGGAAAAGGPSRPLAGAGVEAAGINGGQGVSGAEARITE